MGNGTQIIASLNQLLEAARKLKLVLDDETQILRNNNLLGIARLNYPKETSLREFNRLKVDVFSQLEIAHKRFDQVNVSELIKKLPATESVQLKPLLEKLWTLQHQCHNQYIINQNVISARTQFLRRNRKAVAQNVVPEELCHRREQLTQVADHHVGEC